MAPSDSLPGTASAPRIQLDAHHISQDGPSPTSTAQHEVEKASTASSSEDLMRKPKVIQGRTKANSSPSHQTIASPGAREENRATPRNVRTLPPWIDSYEDGEHIIGPKPVDRPISFVPPVYEAQHHYSPKTPERRVSQDGYVDMGRDPSQGPNERKPEMGFFGGPQKPVKGRKWDHARDGDPVIMRSSRGLSPATNSPWRNFVKSSMYGPSVSEDSQRPMNVDFENTLQEQTPGYDRPWGWRSGLDGANDLEKLSRKQRRTFVQRMQHNLLMHPMVPLMFRLIVLTTSIIALGLSTSIHKLSDTYFYAQNPSTTMAVAVDVIAIPYIVWITWDEYTGKPLGLRPPKAKMRLVLIDLFFIIFESANTSLAFSALVDDNGSCKAGQNGSNNIICGRVKALSAILMVAIIAWSSTFAVSIFRLVERVGGREQAE